MELEKDLRKIEQRAYLLLYSDGLLDIAVGLCILFTGFVFQSDYPYLWIVFAVIDLLIWRIAKKYITFPRTGRANFSPGRTRRTSVLVGFAFFSLVSFIVMGIMLVVLYRGGENSASTNVLMLNEFQLVIGIFTVLLLGFPVVLLGVNRFLLYAGLALAALLVSQFQHVSLWSVFLYLGGSITIVGIWTLSVFLVKIRIVNTTNIEEEIDE